MAKLRIIATRNIRLDVDVVADELLAEVETDHSLPTLISMILQKQARIESDEPASTRKRSSGSPRPQAGEGLVVRADGDGQDTPDPSLIPNRPLFDFPELDADLRDLLIAGKVTTLREATEYLAANRGHFRGIDGIGKVGDAKIKTALGL